MRERNTVQCATLSTVTIILICFHCLALSISIHLEYTRTMGRICSIHARTHSFGLFASAWEAQSLILCITTVPLWFSSFKNPIWFHIGQWNSRGWEASEQSIFVMWSTDWAWWVNVCTGSHPSLQSNEFCRKGIYPGQAFLFISLLPDSSRVSSTLYSSALCIFHIGWPFMFYVRQLRGEQLCGHRILCKFRGRERTHFSGRSGAECQTQRARYLRTNRSCRPRPASAMTLP